ncbi:uncharacterized protein LOC141648246 [Silene latifolia]|uniref:uncharacterized protein LOC141648246 n=1 Tax=Silene latifolia TaxID=37657 RepID=UPI003D7709DF
MHTKTDSDLTSLAATTPPRSPPRRGSGSGAVYYVESPSQHDVDKMSYGSSPMGSPTRHFHYHCSPVHHSRESSTSRFSRGSGWRRIHGRRLEYSGHVDGLEEGDNDGDDDGDGDGDGGDGGPTMRFYVGCFLVCFVGLFGLFSLILWGASKSFQPIILVKHMVFSEFTIQAGMDGTGVPTDMLSLNSTVKITYKNPATFFGVHVTSTPLELYHYNLKVASGQMKKFYQKRKSHSNITTLVHCHQVPLYGGMSFISDAKLGNIHPEKVRSVGLNLTFTVRSKAYILGKLVKSKFYTHIRCPVTLDGNRLGKSVNLVRSCIYN